MGVNIKHTVPSILAACAVAYVCDSTISDRKIFGGTTPKTICDEWGKETDRKLQAWPRTAGPPVVMNPLRRQNFFVKTSIDQTD